jgi:hypothetical protein
MKLPDALTFPMFLGLAVQSHAAMTFDQCAALNKGENKAYVQTYTAADGTKGKNTLEISDGVAIEKFESANSRVTIERPLGFFGTNHTAKQITEQATGEISHMEYVAEYDSELKEVVSTAGTNVRELTVRARKNGGTWSSMKPRKVQFKISDTRPVVLNGCSIPAKLIEIFSPKSDGTFGDKPNTRIVYSPAAMLALRVASVYDKEVLQREILFIEPK